jgi:hypothetical protein
MGENDVVNVAGGAQNIQSDPRVIDGNGRIGIDDGVEPEGARGTPRLDSIENVLLDATEKSRQGEIHISIVGRQIDRAEVERAATVPGNVQRVIDGTALDRPSKQARIGLPKACP